jgi:hypothetical protein
MRERRMTLATGSGWAWPGRRRLGLLLLLLVLPLLIGGWRIISGETINPRYVERIKDGITTKQEIMLLFGEPQDIDRTPDGVIYTYKSFKDAPAMPYRPEERKIAPQSDQLYLLPDNKQVKKAPLKTEGKVLRSTLVIRFKPNTDTVLTHEYKEY